MNYIIWKYFYRKTWRNPVISHDFRWKSQFSSKICIFKILINYKKKSNGPNFFFLHFFILLYLFYDCANFRVNRSISCRDLRGGGQISPPPPPMDSSPRNNPMGIGLKTLFNIVEAPFEKFVELWCLCCMMMFRWTIKQPWIQKFCNLYGLYQDIYDWISPLNKRSGWPFILTQQSMGRNEYGIS